jgi:hypothetical protein
VDAPTETQIMAQILTALPWYGVEIDRQNVGGGYSASGQYVRFGRSGDADLAGMITWGPARGKRLEIEVKRPGFNPEKVHGVKARKHWEEQLERMRRMNAQGGYAFWVTDSLQAIHVLRRIHDGWRVEMDAKGWPYVTNETGDAL